MDQSTVVADVSTNVPGEVMVEASTSIFGTVTNMAKNNPYATGVVVGVLVVGLGYLAYRKLYKKTEDVESSEPDVVDAGPDKPAS